MNQANSTREGLDWDQKKRICIICSVLLVVTIVIVVGVIFSIPKKIVYHPKSHPDCSSITNDAQKFDCHPERPIGRVQCLDRGCCFKPASDLKVKDFDLIKSSYVGVPSCFFPLEYKGYEMTKNVTWTGSSIVAELERNTLSGFADDIEKIALEVIPIDDNTLRIKITDPYSTRYVPDVPVLALRHKKERNKKYKVDLRNDGTLKVIRNSTQQVIFHTKLSQLIYTNQFIQLSTDIPSNFIYGLGEQKEGMLKSTNWTRYTLFNQGDIPVPHRNLYGSQPFYMVMEQGGLSSGIFLLNTNAMEYILQPKPAVTIRTIGGILDFFIFLGPTPGKVVSQFTDLFGKPNFPPRWSLGFHLCKKGYLTLDKANDTLQRNLNAGVPVDVQWLDIDSMNDNLVFTYDPVNFARLPEFVKTLHDDGRHYVTMISHGVSNSEWPGNYTAYDEGARMDLFVKDTEGNYIEGKVLNTNWTVYPDFTNPQTAGYWKARFQEFHALLDFDGVWLDMNEPFSFINGSSKGCPNTAFDNPPYLPGRPYPLNTLTICMSARHNYTEHYNEHNIVAYRESKATHSAMAEITGKRPFIISRSTFSGQAMYSGHWSGDINSNWKDLNYSISTMLEFSLYGMAMTGSDICGFRLNATEELCRRWYSLGAFYPFARSHNDGNTAEQDPAAMGSKVVEAAKKALKKRYYFLPYLYTLFYKNHVGGTTVARPLFFEFPRDRKTYKIEDEFLWGPALLIMPAIGPGIKEINPYVPEGIWYETDSFLARTSKGERMTFKVGETDINLAIRAGYILPAQVPGTTVKNSALNPFHLLVALNKEQKAKGELFWDDGESLNTIANQAYNLISFTVKENVLEVTPKKKGYESTMKLELIKIFSLENGVSKVTINKEHVHKMWLEYKNKVLTIKVPLDKNYTLLDALKVEWFVKRSAKIYVKKIL